MVTPLGQLLRRARGIAPLVWHANGCGTSRVEVLYPPATWYEEHSEAMLRLAEHAMSELERELDLTCPEADTLEERVASTLGVPLARLEREWHECARDSVPVKPSEIQHMRREIGVLCSRACWVSGR